MKENVITVEIDETSFFDNRTLWAHYSNYFNYYIKMLIVRIRHAALQST